MSKLGINVTKNTLTDLANVVKVIDDSMEDGKLKVAEGVKIAVKAAPLLKLVKTLKDLKAEIADMDLAEKTEIIEHFEKEFDLHNDIAEQWVEGVLKLAFELLENLHVIGGHVDTELNEKNVTKE